jgi:competence protein ComGC
MVVETKNRKSRRADFKRDDEGQSVLELLLVLPLLMAILMMIIRVNTVIQMSIVDQKYARAQTLYIAGNAAEYPLRAHIVDELGRSGMNQLVVGVSEDPPSDADGESDGATAASSYYIGRRPGGMGEMTDAGDDITRRTNIRVRNTVTICLPPISIAGKAAFEFRVGDGSNPQYNLPEDPKAWKFCSAKLEQRS